MELKSDPPLLNRVVMHIGPIFPSYGYYAVFLFACTFLLSSQYANSSQIRSSWVEKTLIKDLLHDYEKRARPVVDGVSPEVSIGNYSVQQIKVEYGMALMQILQLDENEQILTVSVRSLYVSFANLFYIPGLSKFLTFFIVQQYSTV
ncbi:hypothetical protein AHF37_12173 [Paragonimus kellicotti]|nr:hypothetical protein AHF37_12173 [Paragonimus kellicotti]